MQTGLVGHNHIIPADAAAELFTSSGRIFHLRWHFLYDARRV